MVRWPNGQNARRKTHAWTPPRLPRPYLTNRSGSRRVRFGVDPDREPEGSNTMTNNIQNGRRQGRRELDRDSGRGSEAIGAGRSLNAASMNLGREPVPSELFRARPLEDSVREWLTHLQRAADLFSDEEILALSEDGAVQLVERLVVQPLVLLENDAYIEDHGSTRASVLVVPFTGDPDFFELDPRPLRSRSGAGCMPGTVRACQRGRVARRAHEYAGTIAGRPSGSRLDLLPCVTT